MMRFLHVAVAVVNFLSATQRSCEDLMTPTEINGAEKLIGKWTQIASSTTDTVAEQAMKTYGGSFWIKFIVDEKTDDLILIGSSQLFDLCVTVVLKVILENNTLSANVTELLDAKSPIQIPLMTMLKTNCSDCLLFRSPESGKSRNLRDVHAILMSKRRTVSFAELEEFKKQTECLSLPPPVRMNPDKVLCAEPSTEILKNATSMPIFFINGTRYEFEYLFMNLETLPEFAKYRKALSELKETGKFPEESDDF